MIMVHPLVGVIDDFLLLNGVILMIMLELDMLTDNIGNLVKMIL